MIKVFDFVCAGGHRHELFVHDSIAEIECKDCGQPAQRAPSAPPCILEGYSGSFPGAASKWEKSHEKKGRGSHFQDEE